MANPKISYNPASEASGATSIALAQNTETTLVSTTDTKHTEKSQLSVYFKFTLGTGTSVQVRYYQSPDNGTNWYQIPSINGATGHIDNVPDVWDATSPALYVRDLAMSGTTAIKVTGTAIGGTATGTIVRALVRDN